MSTVLPRSTGCSLSTVCRTDFRTENSTALGLARDLVRRIEDIQPPTEATKIVDHLRAQVRLVKALKEALSVMDACDDGAMPDVTPRPGYDM